MKVRALFFLMFICCFYSSGSLAHGHGGGGRGGGGRPAGGHWGGGHYDHHGGGFGGFYSGSGGLYGYGFPYFGFPYAYPYYSPSASVPAEPVTYIQQPRITQQQYPAGYWYYCTNPDGYYPYVKTCSNGWLQVSPTPPQ